MSSFSVTVTEAVGLGTSLALSGIWYYLYRRSKATVDKLNNAPHMAVDRNLKEVLKSTPGASLQYVVIDGAVKPANEPLTGIFNKENLGVLQKFILREHRLVWSRLSQSWLDDDRVLHERISTVPFVLVGPDETTVKILSPLQASGVYMETIHERFQQGVYGFGDMLGQFLSGQKLKGQLEVEKMLKVGTTLTGVGELVLDSEGHLSLRPPASGSPYFLSIGDFDVLREESECVVALWKTLLVASAVTGAAVLFWVGLRYYRHLKSLWEQDRESREFERLRAEASRLRATVTQGDAEERGDRNCVICLSQLPNCALLDCGHVCCCYDCYLILPQRRCPICRQDIVRVLPLYIS